MLAAAPVKQDVPAVGVQRRPSGLPYGLAVAVIACALLGLTAFSIIQQKHRFDEQAVTTARNTARLLESAVGEALSKSDLTLLTVSAYLEPRIDWARAEDKVLDDMIDSLQAAQPELENLRVIDAQGFARFGRGVPRDKPVSFADREYFQYARDHPHAGLVISKPVLGRLTGKWSIALSRRIETPDGRFNGIVSAIWSADSFGMLMSGFDLGRQGRATLRYRDLSLIYRYPLAPELHEGYGEKQVSPELAALIARNTAEADYVATAADNVERASTLRRVRDFPLFMVVGVGRDDYLADWRRNSMLLGAMVVVLVMLFGLGARRMYLGALRLADSEARWHFALEGSGQGVFDWDIPQKKSYFSPQYKRILGYEDNEIGQAESEWSDRVHPEDLPGLLADIQRHFSGQTFYAPSDFRMRGKDGRYRWISARGILIERTREGLPKRMIGTITDVTDRREMEAQIRSLNANLEGMVRDRTAALGKARAQLQLAADAANLGVWTWEFATNRLGFDQRLNEWYEVPADIRESGLLYDFWLSRMHPDDRAPTDAAAKKAIDAGTPFSETYRIVLPGGQVRFIHSACVLEYDEAGNKIGMVGVNRDITLQHTLDANLMAAKEAAEAANLTKSRFLANMSHEIRTPLNAMIGLSGVMLESGLTDRQREQLRKIQLAGQVLLGVLNDILDHSKIEAGLMKLESSPMQVSQILERARAMFGEQAAQKHLSFEIDIDPAVPQRVLGDALRLQQVVNNLLGNAIKFTAAGGIRLSVKCIEPGTESARLKFEVNDTGIGLTAEEIGRLFTPFVQADASTTRKYGGTGLGLSIARRLVELMGGEIGVVSEPGKFSTFWFSIPARLPAEGGQPVPVAPVIQKPAAELKPVDAQAVLPLIENLVQMLASGQAGAPDESSRIARLLAGTELETGYSAVARAVALYDFESALAEIKQLAAEKNWAL